SGLTIGPEPATLSDEDIALNEERISQAIFHEEDSDTASDTVETGHDWEYEEQDSETLDYSSSHEIPGDT
ncbi:hypothetical protein, partial [Faecalibacillus intestinalis]|uniref:hypothetical protein n=1 Tax=Faecalibacillus intestinalis TaxID=1982626 RepID=UPI001EDDAEF6